MQKNDKQHKMWEVSGGRKVEKSNTKDDACMIADMRKISAYLSFTQYS